VIILNNKKCKALGTAALTIALFAAPVAFAQNQTARSDNNAATLPGYPADQPAAPATAQGQDAGSSQPQAQGQAPDSAPPASPDANAPPAPQAVPPAPPSAQAPPQAAPPPQPAGPVPAQLSMASGTVIPVRITGWLSSEQNHPGDTFSASLDQPLVVNGWVVARKGQTVIGRVTTVKKAGHFGSVSELGLELSMLTLVDGQQASVQSKLVQNTGRSTADPDAATVGVTTGVGAAVGAAADGGYGAGLGAGLGAIVGLAGVMTSHGSPTIVRPETLLSFQLQSPITITTEQSRMAFQPVRPSDYRGDQDAYARPGGRPSFRDPGDPYQQPYQEAYPPELASPYPYYPYYPYYGWGYYPGPVIGLGFGFGYGRGYGFYGRGWRR